MSRDLFGDRVLIERQAFVDAQAAMLATEREALVEEGSSFITPVRLAIDSTPLNARIIPVKATHLPGKLFVEGSRWASVK